MPNRNTDRISFLMQEAQKKSKQTTSTENPIVNKRTETTDAKTPEGIMIDSFGVKEKRKYRIQIMLTEREFDALDSKLTRRDSLSDYCRNRMIQEAWFDE